jgi:ankyrin repeat protein
MYVRILIEIPDGDRRDALVLLRWITYAKRPLTVQELLEATVIEPSSDEATEGAVDVENRGSTTDVLAILAGLIVIEGGDDNSHYESRPANDISGDTVVKLAHFSIKEFLESSRILESDAKMFHLDENMENLFLTDCCISYLNYYGDSPAKCAEEMDLAKFPLLKYACSNWYHHAKSPKADRIAPRIASLLMSDHRRRDWLRCHPPDFEWVNPFASELIDTSGCGLYYASFLGLESVVRELLRKGVDVNAEGGKYGFPLQAAAVSGNLSVMQRLIDQGAEINARGGVFSNALIAATRKGYAKSVQLLLDRGAHLDVDPNNLTALHLVGTTDNTAVADVILASGVSVNLAIIRKVWEPTWISERGWMRRQPVWSFKEDPGIPAVGSTSKRGLTPLHYAALTGSVAMTKYFIGRGADTNAKSNYGETPLHLTVKRSLYGPESQDGWTDSRCRIEHALDIIGHEDEDDYTDVKKMVNRLRNELVDALMDHEKIELDCQDYLGRSVLHCVPYRSPESTDILSRLLRGNINIDARDPDGRTALHLACIEGNVKAVSLLIERGADILAEHDSGRNLAHFAAAHSFILSIELLKTLERHGVRLDEADQHSRTILHHCARSGSLWTAEVANFLINHVGLSPTAPDAFGESPLIIANAQHARMRVHGSQSFDANQYKRTARLLTNYDEGSIR